MIPPCEAWIVQTTVAYNRERRNGGNLFGPPNKKQIKLKTIKRIADALTKRGNQVIVLEGDQVLVGHLKQFMPQWEGRKKENLARSLTFLADCCKLVATPMDAAGEDC